MPGKEAPVKGHFGVTVMATVPPFAAIVPDAEPVELVKVYWDVPTVAWSSEALNV